MDRGSNVRQCRSKTSSIATQLPSARTANRIAKQWVARDETARWHPGDLLKKIANLLDLSVIFVTLGTPDSGEMEDGRFAHFLFVGRIRHGFERVTGDYC